MYILWNFSVTGRTFCYRMMKLNLFRFVIFSLHLVPIFTLTHFNTIHLNSSHNFRSSLSKHIFFYFRVSVRMSIHYFTLLEF